MDFLDNNKDLLTHEMKRKTKMENQRGFPGCFANLQTKLKNFPFYFTIPRLLSGNQKNRVKETVPFCSFKERSRSSNTNLCFTLLSLFEKQALTKNLHFFSLFLFKSRSAQPLSWTGLASFIAGWSAYGAWEQNMRATADVNARGRLVCSQEP